jgi:hypothetical protein
MTVRRSGHPQGQGKAGSGCPVRGGIGTKARITHGEWGVITPPAQSWRPGDLNLTPWEVTCDLRTMSSA